MIDRGQQWDTRAVSLGRAAGQIVLFAVFTIVSLDKLTYLVRHPEAFGATGRLYLRAAQLWLNGKDPWTAVVLGDRFGAPPPTLVIYAPLVGLGEDLAVAVLMGVGLVAAIIVIRKLSLPSWWLLFPPLFETAVQGSLDGVMFALLLFGGVPAGIAPVIKIYAVVPLILRKQVRAIALLATILILTLPLLPWQQFLADRATIAQNLIDQSKRTSAWGQPVLFALATLALLALGRRRSAWAAVPALWPYAQRHYGLMAIAAKPPMIVSGLLALEIPGAGGAAILAWAAWDAITRRVSNAATVREGVEARDDPTQPG